MDSAQQAAWYVHPESDHFVQGWYDDRRSWTAQLAYVGEHNLAGVGIWVLDGANDSPEMWNILPAAF